MKQQGSIPQDNLQRRKKLQIRLAEQLAQLLYDIWKGSFSQLFPTKVKKGLAEDYFYLQNFMNHLHG